MPPAPQDIQIAVDRLVASPLFRTSERLCQLLRFTVGTSLDGRAHELKESVIAVEVFGREASFDPRLDAIVRVNMAKLRARLAEYYLDAGARDQVRIEYPRGAYVPQFVEQRGPDKDLQPADAPLKRRVSWVWAVPVAVALAVTGWWLVSNTPGWRGIASTPGSVAVLPFVDLSDSKDQETFCDSLTEEIIDQIGRRDDFRVVGRTSSFEFKGRSGDLREIGLRLGAERVLEGSVRRSGGRIRVTANLNETSTGYRVWSERWERDDGDPLVLQDEIGRAIAARVAVAKQEAAPSRERLEARALYLKGRHFYDQGNMDRALELYEDAAATDPSYAQAHAGRARALIALASGGRSDLRNPGHAAADTALRLDPSTLEAYAARVQAAHFVDFDWAAGVKACEEGASYGGNDAPFRRHCALLLSLLGDFEPALAEIREAVLIEPAVASYGWAYSFILFRAGLFDEAVKQISATLELRSDELRGHLLKALVLAYAGNHAEAQASLQAAEPFARQDPKEFETVSAVVNAFAGNTEEARRIIARGTLPDYLQARVHSALGDVNQTLTLLEQSAARGEQETVYVLADPGLLRYRALPRYQELRHRFRLPPMRDRAAMAANSASATAR